MAYSARIESQYNYEKEDESYAQFKSDSSVVINAQLVGEVWEVGEPIDPDKPDEKRYDYITDGSFSVREFWAATSTKLHMNIATLYSAMYYLNNDYIKYSSIFNFLRLGGAQLQPLSDYLTNNNRDIYAITLTNKQISIAQGNVACAPNNITEPEGITNVRTYFYLNGRKYGNQYDSLCPAYVSYTCDSDASGRNIWNTFTISLLVFDEHFVTTDSEGSSYFVYADGGDPTKQRAAMVTITGEFDSNNGTGTNVKNVNVYATAAPATKYLKSSTLTSANGLRLTSREPIEDEFNPYMPGIGRPDDGGDGKYDDETHKVPAPDLPSVDITNSGMFTAYKCTMGQLNQIADYLSSPLFDLDTFKKLWQNPMDSIVGITCIPVDPNTGSAREVTFGTQHSGISLPVINDQFKEIEVGSITIDKYWGNFADYAPHTSIQIYLPFIGFRDLDPSDVMGHTLSIVYRFDVITGACVAMINVDTFGYIYSFSGSAVSTMPMSATDFSSTIRAFMDAFGQKVGMVGNALSGNYAGIANNLLQYTSSLASSGPTVTHSGQISGSAGLMGIKRVYVIITRPKQAVPAALPKLHGLAASYSAMLSSLSGFTQCVDMHLENIPCTNAEKQEIENLLKTGVIL